MLVFAAGALVLTVASVAGRACARVCGGAGARHVVTCGAHGVAGGIFEHLGVHGDAVDPGLGYGAVKLPTAERLAELNVVVAFGERRFVLARLFEHAVDEYTLFLRALGVHVCDGVARLCDLVGVAVVAVLRGASSVRARGERGSRVDSNGVKGDGAREASAVTTTVSR